MNFGNGSFSIAYWVKGTVGNQNSGYRLIVKGTSSGGCGNGHRYEIYHYPPGNDIAFVVDDDNNKSEVSIDASVLLDNAWKHVVAIRDRSAGNLRFYLNGSLAVAPSADSTNTTINNSCDLYIGSDNLGVGNAEVEMDDVRFYNRVLTPAEIQSLYELRD